jgi:hypothetical protein
MINLLPYETKQQTRNARINTILLRSIVVLGIAIGFLAIACFITYFFINDTVLLTKSATVDKSSASIQSEADTIKTNLANAKTILGQNNDFSKVITTIAAIMPDGTDLMSLSLNDGSFGTTTSLQLLATSPSAAKILQSSFGASSDFSNFKLISTTASQSPNVTYPYLISFSVTVNKVVSP